MNPYREYSYDDEELMFAEVTEVRQARRDDPPFVHPSFLPSSRPMDALKADPKHARTHDDDGGDGGGDLLAWSLSRWCCLGTCRWPRCFCT